MRHFSLTMGKVHASAEPCAISTVLGSCIAVCLWDAQSGIGGMNHYMLPHWDGQGLPTPRFGNVAIPRLLEVVLGAGAARRALVAKVFGGGAVLGTGDAAAPFNVGARNADYALRALELEEIPVIAMRVKADHGVKVTFDTQTGEVLLRRLVQRALSRSSELLARAEDWPQADRRASDMTGMEAAACMEDPSRSRAGRARPQYEGMS